MRFLGISLLAVSGLVAASAGLHHLWMSLPATPQEFRAYRARFDHVIVATGPHPSLPAR